MLRVTLAVRFAHFTYSVTTDVAHSHGRGFESGERLNLATRNSRCGR
jgi:hypothetical protein